MRSWVIVTETFRGLVMAQAKARKVEPRLLVVRHPVGGLSPDELSERIDTAFGRLKEEIGRG
ncbi:MULTISPECIES: hypothetical protein [Xanthobacter]|uniref:hypothetical protein n=1 Tax=Xanthobacter TaxID=279 RepID=UPI002022C8D1|nr:hypothetical protein [Xanthobacter aminoxidans]MCL8383527.1 hypothetical protein [Xanthobacter aminoxidans]